MKFWALLIAGAISPYLFTSALSNAQVLALMPLCALLAVKPAFRSWCLLPVFFLFTSLAINHRLAQRLPVTDNKVLHSVSGVIGSLPESRGGVVSFIFLPDAPTQDIPRKLKVIWYQRGYREDKKREGLPVLHAGERWQFQLELRPTRARLNFNGVDAERWTFAQGIAALGYVQTGENVRLAEPWLFDLNHLRELVLQKLEQKAGHLPAFSTLVALAIADRRAMSSNDREVLSATGTGHLLAISGLHIGLAAALGFYLGRLILLIFAAGLRQRLAVVMPWVFSWCAALAYAGLAGFGVSTQRALIMLSVATFVMLSRRNVHPALAWLIALAMVLMIDPFAPLRAGFWFSFTAVAVLMLLLVPRQGKLPLWRQMLLMQAGISLVMAPLSMFWFQQVSLSGFFANLIAIPLVSMVTVPLILIAMLLLWLPGSLVLSLLTVAAYSAHWLFLVLEQITAWQPVLSDLTHAPSLTSTLFAMLGALILFLPRGISVKAAGILLMIPIFLPSANPPGVGHIQVDFLDVGQGLAVMVAGDDYLMIYDTGPGNGNSGEDGWDMVIGSIQPMIKATGKSPDLVVISHADLDHAGGLGRFLKMYPDISYMGSLPEPGTNIKPCVTPNQWSGGGLRFRVLHPSSGLPYLGNDSSCVISVTGNGLSLLLTGDISRVIEQRLGNIDDLQHDIVTVPHHGSSTSSSSTFIGLTEPELALISAARNNRFEFPRKDVLERYANAGTRTLNTADCGGIKIIAANHEKFQVRSARVRRAAIWRWSGDPACP